jgi:hypothetical protein
MEKEDSPKFKNFNNDIRFLKNYKFLEKINLNLDSPRIKEACFRLGLNPKECLIKYQLFLIVLEHLIRLKTKE